MNPLPLALLVALPPLVLLATGLVPTGFANRHARGLRDFVLSLAGLSLAAAAAAATLLVWTGPVDRGFWEAPGQPALNVGIYYETLSAVMTVIIAFVGA
jgi:NADH:ubiquinone oxidoreductase subunit 5 (subunit L)/multisubunit Na+/H+ antiporter MnhA subunit